MHYRLLLLFSFLNATIHGQIQDKVDFTEATISIDISPKERQIKGIVDYKFDVLNAVDSIFLDAKEFNFSSVHINHKKVEFSNDGQYITVKKKFKKGKTYILTLAYIAKPKQTVYFVGWDTSTTHMNQPSTLQNQVWTQGQGKYTSYWLPSFDDMNEKVEFDMNITFDDKYTVIANGQLIGKQNRDRNKITWSFDMQKPMSSYLLAFAVGNYSKKTLYSKSGILLEQYYYPQDSLKVEPTYRYSKEIFNLLEDKIGVPYPWQDYKQIPVKDFLYAGMENTSATIFSDAYVIDSTAFIDKNYVNVNAHELAHQWFGDLVTEVDGNHHWLQEGFATYYALLAEQAIFGDDYYYWKLYNAAQSLNTMSLEGKGEALSKDNASSLTFYEKGAWALVFLKNELGEAYFKKGIKAYVEKYQFKNVTIRDFLSEMERVSGKSLLNFESIWLNDTTFPYKEVETYLKNNSESIASYVKLQNELKNTLTPNDKIATIVRYFQNSSSIALKKKIILEYAEILSEDFIKKVFLSTDIEIRQAVVLSKRKITQSLKREYESLLNDKSYVTLENVLYKLWFNFPADRKQYLDQTQDIVGLPDKNIRLLWLTLALVTQDYNNLKTKEYFDELGSYTSPDFSMETRQTAFQYLFQTLGLTDVNLKDLANAAVHHSWQFKKFARSLLDELLKDEDYKNRITALVPMLNQDEKRYISSKLGLK
tara:strand:- start:67026 stop:69143 length:2118 start_codon:yes stop_codon:yes gene_type:complete